VTKGYKVCGRREGKAYLEALRPVTVPDRDGKQYLQCPGFSIPCDNAENPYSEGMTVDQVLKDINAKENKMICAPEKSLCPITQFKLDYIENTGELDLFTDIGADTLPYTKFVISAGPPCLSPHEVPQGQNTVFTDELTRDLAGCSTDRFYGGSTDERYEQQNVMMS